MTAPTPEGLAEARAIVKAEVRYDAKVCRDAPFVPGGTDSLTHAIAAALDRERAGRVAAERERDEARRFMSNVEWEQYERVAKMLMASSVRITALETALRRIVEAHARLHIQTMPSEVIDGARALLTPPAPPGARA